MPKVVIDGIEYVPKTEVLPLNDSRLQECLECLSEMVYFKQNHKMNGLALNAIRALSRDLYELACRDENAFYEAINGSEEL